MTRFLAKEDSAKRESLIPVAFYHHVMRGYFYGEKELIGFIHGSSRIGDDPISDVILFSGISEVLHYGLKKYGRKDSWQLVEDGEQRYFDAFMRHAQAQGELDSESGLAHWKHAACNLMFIWWFNAQKEVR